MWWLRCDLGNVLGVGDPVGVDPGPPNHWPASDYPKIALDVHVDGGDATLEIVATLADWDRFLDVLRMGVERGRRLVATTTEGAR